jgi:hypothetical protein
MQTTISRNKGYPDENLIDKAHPDENPIDKAHPDYNPIDKICSVSVDCDLDMLCFCGL